MALVESLEVRIGAIATDFMTTLQEAIRKVKEFKRAAEDGNLEEAMGAAESSEKLKGLLRQIDLNEKRLSKLNERAQELRKTLTDVARTDIVDSSAQEQLQSLIENLDIIKAQIENRRAQLAALIAAQKDHDVSFDEQQLTSLQTQMNQIIESSDQLAIKIRDMESVFSATDTGAITEELANVEGKMTQLTQATEEAKATVEAIGQAGQQIDQVTKPIEEATTAASDGATQVRQQVDGITQSVDAATAAIKDSTTQIKQQIDSITQSLNLTSGQVTALIAEFQRTTNAISQSGSIIEEELKRIDRSGRRASTGVASIGRNAQRAAKNSQGPLAAIEKMIGQIVKRVFIMGAAYKAVRAASSFLMDALKTNEQFSSSLQAIKVNLATAFQPIYEFVLPAINALMSALASATAQAAAFISALFGKTYDQSKQAAQGLQQAKDALKEYGKEAKSQTASFDKFNDITQQAGDSAGDVSGALTVADFEAVEPPDLGWLDALREGFERFAELLEPAKKAMSGLWDTMKEIGGFAWSGLQDFYSGFLAPVGKWVLGEGLPNLITALDNMLKSIDWGKIFGNLRGLWGALAPLAIEMGKGLLWFYENVLLKVAGWTLGTALPEFLRIITDLAEGIDLTPVSEALSNLWKFIEPFAEVVGEGLFWFLDNVIRPLATWTINKALPAFLGLLSSAFDVLTGVLNALKPLGQWLWNSLLEPLATWSGGIAVSIISGLTTALKGFSDWIRNNQKIIETLTIIIGSFAAAWGLVNAAIGIWNAVVGAWNAIGLIATAVTTAFGAAVAFLTSPIGLVVLAIGALIAIVILLAKNWDWVKEQGAAAWEWIKQSWNDAGQWFSTTVVEPTKKFFSDLWEKIKKFASDAWISLKETWQTASTWFNDKVIIPIINFFVNLWDTAKNTASSAWESVKRTWSIVTQWFDDTIIKPLSEAFSGLWEGVKSSFISAWNAIVGAFESALNFIISGVNSVLSLLNRINISIPPIVVMGKTVFGGMSLSPFNFASFESVSLPRLARGGLAYGEVAAIVGDNPNARQNPEIIAPLSDLQRMITAAMLQRDIAGGGSNGEPIEIRLTLDNIGDLVRLSVDPVNKAARQLGYEAVFRPAR